MEGEYFEGKRAGKGFTDTEKSDNGNRNLGQKSVFVCELQCQIIQIHIIYIFVYFYLQVLYLGS